MWQEIWGGGVVYCCVVKVGWGEVSINMLRIESEGWVWEVVDDMLGVNFYEWDWEDMGGIVWGMGFGYWG